MLPASGAREERADRDVARVGRRRRARAPAAHRHDGRSFAGRRGHPAQVGRHAGLPDPLAGPDHGERRNRERILRDRRIEPEVGADVRQASRERHRGQLHPPLVVDDRLVGQVEHRVGRELSDRGGERMHRVGLAAADRNVAELQPMVAVELLRPSHHQRAEDLVTGIARDLEAPSRDRRIVLAVDERDDPHRFHPELHPTTPASAGPSFFRAYVDTPSSAASTMRDLLEMRT